MPGSGQLGAKMASPALLLASNRVFVKRAIERAMPGRPRIPSDFVCDLPVRLRDLVQGVLAEESL